MKTAHRIDMLDVAGEPMHFSSAPTTSSIADAVSSWRWRHAIAFLQSTLGANSWRPVA
jgi:hypothetical protein